MLLQTERLLFQELTLDDLQFMHDLHSMPEVDEFNTLGIPENILITETLLSAWIAASHEPNRLRYIFTISLKESTQRIGLLGLNIGKPSYHLGEIWYKLHPDHWNRGYATESASALLKFGFETLKLHRMEAGCAVNNTASIKVLEKVGMQLEGRKRKLLPIRKTWVDNFGFAILEEDYIKIHG